jgi:protein-S-isoprenylcysteine O-methyltransferase Ste14
MILAELKALKPTPSELRKFGLLVGAVFAVIGLWLWWRHRAAFPWFLGGGSLLLLLGAFLPRVLHPIYLVWMSVAIVLGFIVSHVLLGLLFFFVITPVGLLARMAGKDFLSRKLDPKSSSYWIRRPTAQRPKTDYESQF